MSEIRTFIPRHAEDVTETADRNVVGAQGILNRAVDRAAGCAPPQLRDYAPPGCAAPASGCDEYKIVRSSLSHTAAATAVDLTFTFQQPFKLAKLTVRAADADSLNITEISVAGDNLLKSGPVNGGIFSSANEESGGEIDGPWMFPGQELRVVGTFAAAVATASPVTVSGIGK
jgi:hypothetical protein